MSAEVVVNQFCIEIWQCCVCSTCICKFGPAFTSIMLSGPRRDDEADILCRGLSPGWGSWQCQQSGPLPSAAWPAVHHSPFVWDLVVLIFNHAVSLLHENGPCSEVQELQVTGRPQMFQYSGMRVAQDLKCLFMTNKAHCRGS